MDYVKLVFDVEATGAQRNKAHPFDYTNKACNMGFRDMDTGKVQIYKIEYDEEPYGENLQKIRELIGQTELLVGFNLKYDLHWLRRYGITISDNCRVFDSQLAWFILTNQLNKYPSLDGVAEYYKVAKKLDVVKAEYWDKGMDTDEVPYNILSEYLEQDLNVTQQVYDKVIEHMKSSLYETQKLISVSMQDLIVLEDIEWNGLLYNVEKSNRLGNEIQEEIDAIDGKFKAIVGEDWFNTNSGDHLSWFLYGGTLMVDGREEYEYTYKDGSTTIKSRKAKVPKVRRGIFRPLEGTDLSKPGFYSTDVATLVTLSEKAKGEAADLLELLLLRSKIEKQRSTYFHGFPKKILEMNWEDKILHSSFNQTVVVSGRLSSAKPNVQNLEKAVKECIETRF